MAMPPRAIGPLERMSRPGEAAKTFRMNAWSEVTNDSHWLCRPLTHIERAAGGSGNGDRVRDYREVELLDQLIFIGAGVCAKG